MRPRKGKHLARARTKQLQLLGSAAEPTWARATPVPALSAPQHPASFPHPSLRLLSPGFEPLRVRLPGSTPDGDRSFKNSATARDGNKQAGRRTAPPTATRTTANHEN